MKELEIEITIPEGMKIKGVRTAGNTIIAVLEPEVRVNRIGFIVEPPEETEEEYDEEYENGKA